MERPLGLDLQAHGLAGALLQLGHAGHQQGQHGDDKQGNGQANTLLMTDHRT